MNNLLGSLEFYTRSGSLNQRNKGKLLLNLINSFKQVCIQLENDGRIFSPQIRTDLLNFKKEILNSATFQKNYILFVRNLQNEGFHSQTLLNIIQAPFDEIQAHLDGLFENFSNFLQVNGFTIDSNNTIIADEQQEFHTEEHLSQGVEHQAAVNEQVEQAAIDEQAEQVTVSEQEEVVSVVEPVVTQTTQVEPLPTGESVAVMQQRNRFIQLAIPLDSFHFSKFHLCSFGYFKNTHSFTFKPELQMRYSNTGWSIKINSDINFTLSNVLTIKPRPLGIISVQVGNNMGEIAVNSNCGIYFSFSHRMISIKNTNLKCGVNFNASDTIFQLQNFSFTTEIAPTIHSRFLISPALCYEYYPFWKYFKTSTTQPNQLIGVSNNSKSTHLMYESPKSQKPSNSFGSISMSSPNKMQIYNYTSGETENLTVDSQIWKGESPLGYTTETNTSTWHFPTSSLILVGIAGISFFTIKFLQKLVKFTKYKD